MKKLAIVLMGVLAIGLVLTTGCKKDAKGTTPGEELLPEAQTGPVEFPSPRRSTAERKPVRFEVSVEKVYVLPLSEDGKCWDACPAEAKTKFAEALPSLGGESVASAVKAFVTGLAAAEGSEPIVKALPDLYVNIDCGNGNELRTSKGQNDDRLSGKWNNAREEMKLSWEDECAIGVYDGDEDGQDELIGEIFTKAVKDSKNGELILTSNDKEMGQVVRIELLLTQLEGASVWDGGSGSGTAGTGTGSGSSAGSGSGSGGSGTVTPNGPAGYYVQVIKANLQGKKKDGQAWDAKIPFKGKAGDELPDPFVQVFVNGYKSERPFMQTEPVTNKNYCEWNKQGEAALNANDKLHFMVFDKDAIDHDLMGECISEPLSNLKLGQEIYIRNCGQVDWIAFKVWR